MSEGYPLFPEDTLWSKFKEIKRVLELTSNDKATRWAHVKPRFDDSGRFVDMTEVKPRLFIGSV